MITIDFHLRGNIEKLLQVFFYFEKIINIQKITFFIPGKSANKDKNIKFCNLDLLVLNEAINTSEFGIGFTLNEKNIRGMMFSVDGKNHFSISIPEENLEKNTLIKVFKNISESMVLDLAYIFHYENNFIKFTNSYLSSKELGYGLNDGLRDVYWVNYYGSSFAELIGKEKLLDLPVSEANAVDEGVYFKLTENPEDAFALKDAIKAQIGEQYFVPKDIEGKKHMDNTKQRSGIFGVFAHLLHLSKSPETILVAESRPEFDNKK